VHTAATHSANVSQAVRQQTIDLEHRFDSASSLIPPPYSRIKIYSDVSSQLQSLADIIHDGPRHNDDSLLASLAHGHNGAMASITQLQQIVTESAATISALQDSVQMNTAMLGEINRAVAVLLAARDTPALAAPQPFPALAPPPALVSVPPPAFNLVPGPIQAVTPLVQASPFVAAALPAPAPAPPVSAPPAAAAAVSDANDRMQAMFSAAFAAALGNGKRARDDAVDDDRNVRPRSDAVDAPSSSSTTGPPDAPAAPPRRPPTDPAREFIFGPVRWKTNINSEARTIIAEGMEARPNMRGFSTRRGPDNEHIIGSFETAGSTAWFIETWMAQRSGRWSSVVARPNV
jgi:hypothetical protein